MTAQAIVVLGCRLPRDGRPGSAIERRVEVGVALLASGAAPFLVMSGGGDGPRAEADVMRDLAVQLGAPETALLLERQSRNTLENATSSAVLLKARGLQRVILVTERYHLFRARLLFRSAGLDVVGEAAPPTQFRRDWLMWLREALALPRSLLRLVSGY
jgi:uncharacterized SAM-binding protein YcdF (DUF218 family)